MAFIQRKKREEDDEIGIRQSEFAGLGMDLGLVVCPQCRREVPDWRDTCEDCGKRPVPKAGLPPAMPDIPEHLVAPDPELEALLNGEYEAEDEDEVEEDDIEEVIGDQPQSKKGKRSWLRWT
ncbi:hypothetical protein [Stomatohabitans albus]|uniref:hypothetical protein n=1 Tax=Stomatohabitans albus TaxID=3110766 RepID=UPI00300C09EF